MLFSDPETYTSAPRIRSLRNATGGRCQPQISPPFNDWASTLPAPPGDGLASSNDISETSGTVDHSQFTWISSWATTTTGTDHMTYTPYLGQQSSSASPTGSSSSSSSDTSSGVSRIVIPVVVAILVALACAGGILLVRWRRQRALRAHRRKSSWMVSNKFKWPGDTKAPFEDTLRESEGSPPFTPLPAPGRVATHERKTSIL